MPGRLDSAMFFSLLSEEQRGNFIPVTLLFIFEQILVSPIWTGIYLGAYVILSFILTLNNNLETEFQGLER